MKPATYRNYLLGVLLVILACNYLDRAALALVLQDIKTDLSLTDTQLGLLGGIAFALFYSVMGIPIARWADRGNRVTIIALTAAIWSVAVALCGMASSYAQLLLIRVGVAVGEAGCIPPALSLISDHFSRAERPRAVSIYMLGGPLAVVLGYFVAGWLNELYGWRAMFVLLGLPGLALGVVAWLTLKEPRRESGMVRLAARADPPGFGMVCATLWNQRTFRHLLFGYSVIAFFGYGIATWLPAFFVRSFGFGTGELGIWFALIWGAGGMLGTFSGGRLASRYGGGNERLQLQAMALACAAYAVISACIYLSPSRGSALAWMSLAAIGVYMIYGPLFATIQTLVPHHMRGVAMALVYLFANLIGMGLGPLAAGALSDALRPFAAEESLRYSLLTLCPGYFWAAGHLWHASRTVMPDLQSGASEKPN